MTHILEFGDNAALAKTQTGGKGVNLARLAQAGFAVPPGFVVAAVAFSEFLESGGLGQRLAALAADLAYDDPGVLERQTAAIRDAILWHPMPDALAAEIRAAYEKLGGDLHVAVRSSGTAEDLAEASFAGQHDTYLDILGAIAVIDAVRRCWASLWTARAAGYRRKNGFDHATVSLAVVVQKMVRSDVSGVMFTGNPLTTATDEIVINATWGLGEALVQGIVTPDEVIVQMPSRAIIDQMIGEKEVRIVRDEARGSGVVEQPVPAEERRRPCLDTAAIASLVDLGTKVQSYYGGFPQDIEWGIEDGVLYLLQSRPVTGAEFSWDIDVDAQHKQTAPADTIWTRAYANSITTGAVSPLTYSTRFHIFSGRNFRRLCEIFDFPDLAETRLYKYWKGELYYNADAERLYIERLVPPAWRGMFLDWVPATQRQTVLDAPFDKARFQRIWNRWHLLDPETTPTGFIRKFESWRTRTDTEGLSNAELRTLDDEAVIAYCNRMTEIFGQWNDFMWVGMKATFRLVLGSLSALLARWYDGDPRATFARLVGGTSRRTDTQIENAAQMELVNAIRRSPVLRTALDAHSDGAFFSHLAGFDEGRVFLKLYEDWIARWGHRGHADRDYMYPRRSEDPAIDVRAFKLMLNVDEGHDAGAHEREIMRARDAFFEEVLANVATKPRGGEKVETLRYLYRLVHEYSAIRDNERARPTDTITFARKRGYLEIGRRLYERGQIGEPRDFHFLSEIELFQMFRGRIEATGLIAAKIKARARNVDRMLRKEVQLPLHLRRHRPIDLENTPEAGEEGVFKGSPTSPGTITAIARVVRDHAEMGRVNKGEILVTHSTDPGWNPVFGVISGVVVETGGMLSHASCLAREYGFPAVHLPNAARLIPDGAWITVNGDSGVVTIADPRDHGGTGESSPPVHSTHD